MSDPGAAGSTLTTRKLLTQLVGFVIGLGLLAWCIHSAIKGGGGKEGEGWDRIRHADPLLVMGLMGCTLASLLVNGGIFWLVIWPVRKLKLLDMQLLNVVTSILNYAPIRAGLIARVAYNVRVDRLSLLTIGGWFAAIGFTMMLTMGAVVMATVLHRHFDWIWCGLVAGQLIVGAVLTRSILGLEIVQRIGKGMDRMLSDGRALWGAIGLRLVDIAAYAGRMACAVAIMGLPLSTSDVLLLAICAIAVSLNPLGRVGYREAGVAFFAGFLGMTGHDFDAQRIQLALVESAGEAIVAIPLGALALLWYRKKWISVRYGNGTS